MIGDNDKLVLFIEEEYEGSVDMTCYVLYDHTEGEYFVCGQRLDELKYMYSTFHFYCKSRKSLLRYIRFIVNADDSKITYGLFNFNGLFRHSECVDYALLNSLRSNYNEIAVYNKMDYEEDAMRDVLRIIKDVRY
jgi:hypothetical protein